MSTITSIELDANSVKRIVLALDLAENQFRRMVKEVDLTPMETIQVALECAQFIQIRNKLKEVLKNEAA